MFVIFSHLVAFATLFVAAISDLETTDVPDIFGFAGVIAGLALHAGQSYATGSIDPFLWSIGVGLAFSVYGWGLYLVGMWGGADAFAMSVLGFAAPYALTGPGVLYPVNLFINVMLLGFVYSLLFAVYKAFQAGGVFGATAERIREEERRIAAEVFLAGTFSALFAYWGFSGLLYFLSMVSLIFLYRFFQVLQGRAMSTEVSVAELEPGAVVDISGVDIGVARQENSVGRLVGRLSDRASGIGLERTASRLEELEETVGYPEVVGIRQEEIEKLEEVGVETVEVKTGARFVPVFPVALAFTDIAGGGMYLLLALF